MRFASVILDIPTQALDAPYTYAFGAPSADGALDVEVGCAVAVPLGSRRAVGFVVETFESTPEELGMDPARIRPVEAVVGGPYFNEDGAACARYVAARYVAPLSTCVRLLTPPGGVPKMVNRGGHWVLEAPAVGEVDDRWVVRGESFEEVAPARNAVKQRAVLSAVAQGDVRVAELTAEYGAVGPALQALERKGAIRIEHRRRMRVVEGKADAAFRPSAKPRLTAGQQQALAAIERAASAGAGDVVVVDGVTGSGKTEVYLQAIEAVLAQGRSACVLVPEISLTPQTVGRFRGRFGDVVAVMHSRMSQGERYDQWDFIRSGAARVVVGARSALFTPMRDLGLIVIDEEHEASYKQDSAPRYSTRDVAAWMARQRGCALVLGSATPSLEALHACEHDPAWTRVRLAERANGNPMPDITVVDMTAEFKAGHRRMFSRALIGALKRELALGRKAVLLLNQRGFARFLLCRDCGYVPECASCSTSLTYHEVGAKLECHHCGHAQAAPATCPKCGSPYLRMFGAGTQRVEDELSALLAEFPYPANEARLIRMDADTTKGKGAHQRLLEEFAQPGAAVLLGTQMIAKGLDFEDVTVVGVLNADSGLKLPDFRSAERTFNLVSQVAGRAGRAQLPGSVYVQTYVPDAAAIKRAAAYDRDRFVHEELAKRELLGYPPFVRMVNVLVWGQDAGAVSQQAAKLHERISAYVRDQVGRGVTVLPATPCALSKLRGVYRWHILLKAQPEVDISRAVEEIMRKRKAVPGVNVAVDVDPQSLA